MTLRVTIEVVPLGEEREKYLLHTINIHNIGESRPGLHEYSFEVDNLGVSEETVLHDRRDGPFALVEDVLATRWILDHFPEYYGESQ